MTNLTRLVSSQQTPSFSQRDIIYMKVYQHFSCLETVVEVIEDRHGHFHSFATNDRIRKSERHEERLECSQPRYRRNTKTRKLVCTKTTRDPLGDGVWHFLGHGGLTTRSDQGIWNYEFKKVIDIVYLPNKLEIPQPGFWEVIPDVHRLFLLPWHDSRFRVIHS